GSVQACTSKSGLSRRLISSAYLAALLDEPTNTRGFGAVKALDISLSLPVSVTIITSHVGERQMGWWYRSRNRNSGPSAATIHKERITGFTEPTSNLLCSMAPDQAFASAETRLPWPSRLATSHPDSHNNSMHIVVIGGTGHIGTYLIPQLVAAG